MNVSDFKQAAKVVEVVHHNHCCAYRHRARGQGEWFDEFFNRHGSLYPISYRW